MNPFKKILPEPPLPRPCPSPGGGNARTEPDVQLMPILKKPQQVRDFEKVKR